MDCVGLVVLAFDLRDLEIPPYRLSGGSWDQIEGALAGVFRRIKHERPQSGDLLVGRLPRCFHLAVAGPSSIIHADLRVGRVVETPGLMPIKSARVYRKTQQD